MLTTVHGYCRWIAASALLLFIFNFVSTLSGNEGALNSLTHSLTLFTVIFHHCDADEVKNVTLVKGNKLHRNNASLLNELTASDGLNHIALSQAIKIVSVSDGVAIPDNFEEQVNDEKRLLNYLMRHYDSSVRPVRDSSSPVIIRLGITLTQIFDLDEKNQVLTTNIWLDQVSRGACVGGRLSHTLLPPPPPSAGVDR